ncbi:hypothetical protein MBLNU459_g4160t3 [Dothideomycetes sp. NU459]
MDRNSTFPLDSRKQTNSRDAKLTRNRIEFKARTAASPSTPASQHLTEITTEEPVKLRAAPTFNHYLISGLRTLRCEPRHGSASLTLPIFTAGPPGSTTPSTTAAAAPPASSSIRATASSSSSAGPPRRIAFVVFCPAVLSFVVGMALNSADWTDTANCEMSRVVAT